MPGIIGTQLRFVEHIKNTHSHIFYIFVGKL